jgi:predicted SAM-dependent methyltransferase
MKNPINIQFGSGLDFRKGYINLNKEECDLDILPLKFKDCSVDNIMINEVLEHLEKPYEVIKEFHRILVLGGKIKLTVPHLESDFGKNPLHKHYFHENWFYSFDESRKQNRVFSNEINTIPIDNYPRFKVEVNIKRGSDILHFRFPKKQIRVVMTKI